MHPQEQSWLISATQGNNEVSIWDVETGARQKVLWASPTPTLSLNQVMSVEQLSIKYCQGDNINAPHLQIFDLEWTSLTVQLL